MNCRTYGRAPFEVAVVHGGPGAAGEMESVALALSARHGVLEPLQTMSTLALQIDELKTALDLFGRGSLTVVGFSWGAWLGCFLAAFHPRLVSKLILVGSAPFDWNYAEQVQVTRLSRLSPDDRREFRSALRAVTVPHTEEFESALQTIGHLTAKTDTFQPALFDPHEPPRSPIDANIFQSVWAEASALRRSGELLEIVRRIECPVIAIHGDYDPHPAEGVERPLSVLIRDFRMRILRNCGHTPWIEKEARAEFYDVLEEELA